jgi:hypothetical protein
MTSICQAKSRRQGVKSKFFFSPIFDGVRVVTTDNPDGIPITFNGALLCHDGTWLLRTGSERHHIAQDWQVLWLLKDLGGSLFEYTLMEELTGALPSLRRGCTTAYQLELPLV